MEPEAVSSLEEVDEVELTDEADTTPDCPLAGQSLGYADMHASSVHELACKQHILVCEMLLWTAAATLTFVNVDLFRQLAQFGSAEYVELQNFAETAGLCGLHCQYIMYIRQHGQKWQSSVLSLIHI